MNKFLFPCCPAPERPLLIIRLRFGHEEPAVWQRTFEQLKRNSQICDEVWFSTGVGFPELSEHRRYSELMASHADDLRSIGIIPSLQIQATIGHNDSITANSGAAGKKWSSFVCEYGEPCKYVNCPSQPGFLNYMAELSRIYAQWHPGSVWIDDDLRLRNHSPVIPSNGCYCRDCLKLFAAKAGKLYSREELVAKCLNDPVFYAQWTDFATGILCNVAKTIVENVKAFSPETRFGMQHCSEAARLNIHDTLSRCSGKRSASRPGGGAASDHEAYDLIDKAFSMSRQIYTQQGYDILDQICPEIESYPRNLCCKTPQGLRIETMLYLALGADSMSYFILDPLCETPEWYGENLLAPLAADAPHYKDFIRCNANSCPGGLARLEKINPYISIHEIGLPLIGIAQAGASPLACCGMLTAKAVEAYTDEELIALFNGNIILDGAAAMALQNRGLVNLLEGIRVKEINDILFDFCTADPLNCGIENAKNFPWSEERFAFDIPADLPARVLSVYKDNSNNIIDNATVVFEKKSGAKIALVGYAGFHTRHISSARMTMLNRIADHISGNRLPVAAQSPVQALIIPRITAEQELCSVTILNPTIGVNKPFKLLLRGVPSGKKSVFWQIPGEPALELPLEFTTGKEALAEIPSISAWGIGYLKF